MMCDSTEPTDLSTTLLNRFATISNDSFNWQNSTMMAEGNKKGKRKKSLTVISPSFPKKKYDKLGLN